MTTTSSSAAAKDGKASLKKFLDNVASKVEALSTLSVKTLVGPLEITDDKESVKFQKGAKISGMISEIDLLSGDITTRMSDNFAAEYQQLREYHMVKENHGQEIIRKNLEVVKTIAQTLVNIATHKADLDTNG